MRCAELVVSFAARSHTRETKREVLYRESGEQEPRVSKSSKSGRYPVSATRDQGRHILAERKPDPRRFRFQSRAGSFAQDGRSARSAHARHAKGVGKIHGRWTGRRIVSDELWKEFETALIEAKDPRGAQADLTEREFIEAVLFLARTGTPWRDSTCGIGAACGRCCNKAPHLHRSSSLSTAPASQCIPTPLALTHGCWLS